MILIIAEKPSVAKEIANCIGANLTIKDGDVYYRQGNNYIVSNALGHLYTLGEPEDYGYIGRWSVDELPLLPKFSLFPTHNDDEEKEKGLNEQRRLLTKLLSRNDIEYIISATDAGREGELIFRRIYKYNNCTKPVKRLWISSLTEDTILKGMENLLDGSEKDNEYIAGDTRAKADWLFGMSLTRLYSVYFNTTLPVGRVKTPTLSLILQRDEEIKNFVKKPFYKVCLENSARWYNEETDTFDTKEKAQEIINKCTNKQVIVKSVDRKKKSTDRPLLFNLTTLQQEANVKYGYTAIKTLDNLQKLYEAKLTTYPRTDSSYLSSDMFQTIENTLDILSKISIYSEFANQVKKNGLNIDGRVINDKKISDHHAIIPTIKCTDSAINSLNIEQKNILDLIIKRFIAVLSQSYEYNEIKYVFEVENETFKLINKEPLSLGWKKIYQEVEDTQTDENFKTVSYNQDDTFIANNLTIQECETKPPQHYNDKTLLSAMENIDRKMETVELKQYVKGHGIGTPATRASIILELEKNGYIKRDGKSIISTDKAKTLIDNLPMEVKNLEITAQWEQELSNIADGNGNAQGLINNTINTINQVIAIEKTKNHVNLGNDTRVSLGECPHCKAKGIHSNIFEGKKSYYCEKGLDNCGFSIWKENNFLGIISSKNVTDLLSKEVANIKGKSYKIEDTGTYVNIKFVRNSLGKCPRCKKNGKSSQIYEGEKNFYCETGRDGCRFSIWKNDKFLGTITAKNVKEVLSNNATGKTKINNETYHIEDTGQYVNFKKG